MARAVTPSTSPLPSITPHSPLRLIIGSRQADRTCTRRLSTDILHRLQDHQPTKPLRLPVILGHLGRGDLQSRLRRTCLSACLLLTSQGCLQRPTTTLNVHR